MTSIGKECTQILWIYCYWPIKVFFSVSIFLSLWTAEEWIGVRMSIAYFCSSASFAGYWHGMHPDSIDLLVFIYKSILFYQYQSEFMDSRGTDQDQEQEQQQHTNKTRTSRRISFTITKSGTRQTRTRTLPEWTRTNITNKLTRRTNNRDEEQAWRRPIMNK